MSLQVGQPVPPAHVQQIDGGWTQLRESLALANSIQSQLLTVSAAMLGSGVYFLSKDNVPAWTLVSVLLLLVLSLAMAIYAIVPKATVLNVNSPDQLRRYKLTRLHEKRRMIVAVATTLLVALTTAAVGVIAKAFGG